MKISALFWLALTTLFLVTLTIFTSMNLSFTWFFHLTLIGQALLVFAVYKVLKDSYTTTKTFRDFYEDRPGLGSNNYR